MDDSSLQFLKALLATPSPSGYERPVQDVVRQYVADFADDVRTDVHGNVIACCNPRRTAATDACRPLRPDRHAYHTG